MIRVGTAGWSYADWEGIVYPRQKPRGFHPLAYLTRYIELMEINSTFYATPRADYAARWVEEVADAERFRFSAKLQDVFTHRELPSESEFQAHAHAWLEGIEPLRASGKLAAVLVQFHAGFRRTRAGVERLERIEGAFGHLPLVLEVRHRSWFEADALRRIRTLGYSLANIDLPHATDHPPSDAPQVGAIGYLRVHGRNATTWFDPRAGRDDRYDYLYTPKEVEELARIARRLDAEVDETLVVTNNHFAGQAVTNALEILGHVHGVPPLAPTELVAAYPRLRAATRPDGQDILF